MDKRAVDSGRVGERAKEALGEWLGMAWMACGMMGVWGLFFVFSFFFLFFFSDGVECACLWDRWEWRGRCVREKGAKDLGYQVDRSQICSNTW